MHDPAVHDHGASGVRHESVRDGEGVRDDLQSQVEKELRHLEGRGAAVDDDRLAVLAERGGRPGDRPLAFQEQPFAVLEGQLDGPQLDAELLATSAPPRTRFTSRFFHRARSRRIVVAEEPVVAAMSPTVANGSGGGPP